MNITIGKHNIGAGRTYVIAEIGNNHNGSLDTAKKLIDMAKRAGCDLVKFQKRDIDTVYTKEWQKVHYQSLQLT
jgi:N-acetylneuraminate synthase